VTHPTTERKVVERGFNPELALTPGSPRAIGDGCTCPRMDNANGRGFPVGGKTEYWIDGDCPLHASFRLVESGK
jgi:hypothetical protein